MLDVAGGEEPNVATRRGFEGLAISPDRKTLYPLLEGAVGSDHPQDVLMLTFDIRRRRYRDDVRRIRLEMPGAKVNLTVLFAPTVTAHTQAMLPMGTGPGSRRADHDQPSPVPLLERDGAGDGVAAPRFKKLFLIDTHRSGGRGGYVEQAAPGGPVGGARSESDRSGTATTSGSRSSRSSRSTRSTNRRSSSRATTTIRSPMAGRASTTNERTGPLRPDDNEMILIRLGQPLDVDKRLLSPPD